uniref:Uncharacterized protein n=3 Tax=Opuntia streptacantha TaxID=393608 RepID=A0A7C9EKX0_OPUST
MAAPGKLRVVSVSQVSRAFHPNFCAKWRRYLYMFPLGEDNQSEQIDKREKENLCFDMSHERLRKNIAEDNRVEETGGLPHDSDGIDGAKKPTSFSVAKVDQLLRHLEGKLLSYKMFARDTKASRNIPSCVLGNGEEPEGKNEGVASEDISITRMYYIVSCRHFWTNS